MGTATAALSGEIAVGTSPGGELGGTWASPTVDATHSGSTHGAAVTTHEGLADPHTGYRLESADHSHASTGAQAGNIAATAVTVDSTNLDGTATNVQTVFEELETQVQAAVTTHAGAADPHTGYQLESATSTQYIFISPAMFQIDDAALGQTGASPDLVGQIAYAEASLRSGAFFTFGIPNDWVAATAIKCTIFWYTSTTTGNVRWLLSMSELAAGDAPAEASSIAAAGTTIADSTTVKVTTLYTVTDTSTTDFVPSAAGNIVKVNIERNANVGADSATGAARILMVRMEYTASGR